MREEGINGVDGVEEPPRLSRSKVAVAKVPNARKDVVVVSETGIDCGGHNVRLEREVKKWR